MVLISESTGFYPKEITFAGGASYSPVWAKILASVLNIPVKVPRVKEATSLGALSLMLKADAKYDDIAQSSKHLSKLEAVYYPDGDDARVYDECYARWRKVYQEILKLTDSGTLNYMWKAPGE